MGFGPSLGGAAFTAAVRPSAARSTISLGSPRRDDPRRQEPPGFGVRDPELRPMANGLEISPAQPPFARPIQPVVPCPRVSPFVKQYPDGGFARELSIDLDDEPTWTPHAVSVDLSWQIPGSNDRREGCRQVLPKGSQRECEQAVPGAFGEGNAPPRILVTCPRWRLVSRYAGMGADHVGRGRRAGGPVVSRGTPHAIPS
jgi:hypothetical protein